MKRVERGQDLRRSADRILDTAEGVLIALRRYSLTQAFFDLAHTAARHGVTPVALADALVAIAQYHPTGDCDQRAVQAVHDSWGPLWQHNTRQPSTPPIDGEHGDIDRAFHSTCVATESDRDGEHAD